MLTLQKEKIIREVIDDDIGRFAIIRVVRGREVFTVQFAIPPDGEPTGRLWAILEKRLPH